MFRSMCRNEEEDRYAAALAITQLSEILYKQKDVTSASIDVPNRVFKPNVEDKLNENSADVKSSIAIEGLQLSESPPLDLTIRKTKNEFEHEGTVMKDQQSHNLPSSSLFISPGKTFTNDSLEKTFVILQDHGKTSSNTETANSIQNPCPILVSYSDLIFPNIFLLGKTSLHQSVVSDQIVSNRSNSSASSPEAYCKQAKQTTNVSKFTPQGLSSISKFYRTSATDSCMQEKLFSKGFRSSSQGASCKLKPIALSYLPTGLSSIKEFYNNSRFTRKPGKHLFAKTSKSPDCETSKHEVAGQEHRIAPLPLCVTDETLPSVECQGSKRSQSFNKFYGKASKGKSFRGKPRDLLSPYTIGPDKVKSINTKSESLDCPYHNTSAKQNLNGSSEQNAEIRIPLKVLELSSADDLLIPEKNKSTKETGTSIFEESASRMFPTKVKETAVVQKGQTCKDEVKGTCLKPKITYDFLNPDDDGDFILHIAASQGDPKKMEHYLSLIREQGGDVNCRDRRRQTPLHIAVETSDVRILTLLLDAGANPCLPDLKGQTCLHSAIICKNMMALELMLHHTRNCNALDFEGRTALHLAVSEGNLQATFLLIASKLADIDAKEGKSGKTALYLSAEHNQPSILKMLLENGASDKEPDYSGYTPYQVAMTKQYDEIVKILDEHQKKNKS